MSSSQSFIIAATERGSLAASPACDMAGAARTSGGAGAGGTAEAGEAPLATRAVTPPARFCLSSIQRRAAELPAREMAPSDLPPAATCSALPLAAAAISAAAWPALSSADARSPSSSRAVTLARGRPSIARLQVPALPSMTIRAAGSSAAPDPRVTFR